MIEGTTIYYILNIHAGPSTIHAGPSTIHAGPSTIHAGPSTIHAGPSTIHAGPSTIHAGPFEYNLPHGAVSSHNANFRFSGGEEDLAFHGVPTVLTEQGREAIDGRRRGGNHDSHVISRAGGVALLQGHVWG